MERLFLEILAYHKENLLIERRVNEIVVFAIEHMWDTVRAHKDVTRNIVELIVRDGVEAGEFGSIDARETASAPKRAWPAVVRPPSRSTRHGEAGAAPTLRQRQSITQE
jgi:hypothetical protein